MDVSFTASNPTSGLQLLRVDPNDNDFAIAGFSDMYARIYIKSKNGVVG
jgi:hypothetical protein